MGIRLLGFFVRDSQVAVPALISVCDGLSVLYGLNGAGKSRTIAEIQRFWKGQQSPLEALIQLPADTNGSSRMPVEGLDDWDEDWERARGRWADRGTEAALTAWVRSCFDPEESEFADRYVLPGRSAGLVGDWLRYRLLLVAAAGEADLPQWVSAPALVTGPECPYATSEFALYEAYENSHDDEVYAQTGIICVSPAGRIGDDRTVACAALGGIGVLDMPAYYAGHHRRLPRLTPSLATAVDDINEATRILLSSTVDEDLEVVGNEVAASPALTDAVRQVEAVANLHFARALQDAPTLRLHVSVAGLDETVQWFVDHDHYVATPTRGGTGFDPIYRTRRIDELSTAQRRWAVWGIQRALDAADPQGPGQRLLLLDEPEAALHRSAEAQMAEYVATLPSDGATNVLLATHSPELLNVPTANVYEVARTSGTRSVSELTSASREHLEELGLLPSDLLRRQRGLVLVEGLHDTLVLEALLGAELEALRVETRALRGTHHVSPAALGVLFDYTPAHIFVVFDNIATAELNDLMKKVTVLSESGLVDEAVRLLNRPTFLGSHEWDKLRELIQRCVESGTIRRFTAFGLTAKDVLDYLPVDTFVPGAASWADLRSQHADARKDRPGATARDFKVWLRGRPHNADLSSEHILKAANSLDAIPGDFLQLFKTVQARVG
ncbi:hypothetical protein EKO23_01860 [Nocardioides guangzhouensis]|uniref:ATP-dependent endonuclease n=1 Tax=Nocardioides guangzhouensis TaxID=2497878 RepID=A0A4Q4ZK04_9ACTN|nr:hypothetical protein [Nocardioides guangzhouensis]RYP88660.1 hypothetical protein EKO23_01860 [Nocardioides guangzhouensis]